MVTEKTKPQIDIKGNFPPGAVNAYIGLLALDQQLQIRAQIERQIHAYKLDGTFEYLSEAYSLLCNRRISEKTLETAIRAGLDILDTDSLVSPRLIGDIALAINGISTTTSTTATTVTEQVLEHLTDQQKNEKHLRDVDHSLRKRELELKLSELQHKKEQDYAVIRAMDFDGQYSRWTKEAMIENTASYALRFVHVNVFAFVESAKTNDQRIKLLRWFINVGRLDEKNSYDNSILRKQLLELLYIGQSTTGSISSESILLADAIKIIEQLDEA